MIMMMVLSEILSNGTISSNMVLDLHKPFLGFSISPGHLQDYRTVFSTIELVGVVSLI
jgi:hypothetical protein